MSNLISVTFICPHCGKKLTYNHREKYVWITAVCVYCGKTYKLIWDIKRPFAHIVKSINYNKSHPRWEKKKGVK